ncbi:MAG: serine/threonine protein kinase [Planctomycetaceae bacterium]|nr:serine/threonine protein kinase [Planctomycetaceae bacterium]
MTESSRGTSSGDQLNIALQRQSSEWSQGRRVLPEDLTLEISDENTRRDALLELIHNEVILREEIGELPTLAEYQSRYPELAEELQIQWSLDLAVMGETEWIDSDGFSPDQRCIDRYVLRETLGSGANGVVYKAWDPRLKRFVALKRLRSGIDASSQEKSRLKSEAEAVARLSHENIVQIFDHGEIGDMPWLAMEYCALGTLADLLNGVPLSPKDAARIVLQIAGGVAAAHASQMIHRDLKPSNILLVPRQKIEDRESSASVARPLASSANTTLKVADVIPRVSDFGLARLMDDDVHQTRSGVPLGTPAYMSPEQALGRRSEIGAGTDVYSIGCILYECLTGRPPFRADSVAETLRQVAELEPVAPSRLNPSIPADLNNIVLKCLEKRPAQRYSSMPLLVADLGNFLEGRPVKARPLLVYVRAWRWCRRFPVYASSVAIVLAALVVVIAVRENYVQQLAESRNVALEKSKAATASEQRAVEAQKKTEEQLARAEQNSVWAMEAVDALLQKAADQSLTSIPGMISVRQQLLSEALQQCERFLQDRGSNDPAALFARGIVLQRTGRIHRQIKQLEKSEAELQEAVTLFTDLAAQHPDKVKYISELGKSQYQLALTLAISRNTAAGWGMKETSLKTWNSGLRLFPDDPDLRRGKVNVLSSMGPELRRAGKWKESEEAYREGEKLVQQLLVETPDDLRVLIAGRILRGNYSTLLLTVGRTNEAFELQKGVVTAANRIAQLTPDDPSADAARASAIYGLANIQLQRPESLGDAMTSYEESAQIIDKIAEREPLVGDYAVQAAKSWMGLGIAKETAGDLQGALEAAERALTWHQSILERQPDNDSVKFEYGRILGFTSMLLHKLNISKERAVTLSQQSFDLMKPFGDLAKGPDAVADYLMSVHARLAISPELHAEGSFVADAIQLGRDAMQKFPTHAQLTIAVHTVVGEKWLDDMRRNQWEAARSTAGEAIALSQTDPGFQYGWTIRRALATANAGEYQSAIEGIEPVAKLQTLYRFPSTEILEACSLCAQKAMADNSLSADQRAALSARYVQVAGRILNEQLDAGFYKSPADRESLLNDVRLETLRASPELKEQFDRL